MAENIFTSFFTLNFSNNSLKKEFSQKKFESNKKYYLIIDILSLILGVASLIITFRYSYSLTKIEPIFKIMNLTLFLLNQEHFFRCQ